MQDERILKLFSETLEKYDTANEKKRETWRRLQDAMDMKHDKKYLFHYFLGAYADLIACIWKSGLFSNSNFFTLVPAFGEENDISERLARTEKKIKNQMKKSRAIMKLKATLDTMSYLGSRTGKVIWRDDMGQPDYEGVSNYDMGIDPTKDFYAQDIKITRVKVSWGDLVIMQSEGLLQDVMNVKDAFANPPTSGKGQEDPKLKTAGVETDKLDTPGADTGGNRYIYQMWVHRAVLKAKPKDNLSEENGQLNPEQEQEQKPGEEYEIITDRCYIIEPTTKEILSVPPHSNDLAAAGRIMYKDPYIIGTCKPEEGLTWGRSPVENLLPEQETYNRTQYDWGRTFDLCVQGIWFLELGHKINTDTLYQGKITKVHNLTPNTFRRETIPPVLVTMAYERVQAIVRECDRQMSIWDVQRGGGSGVGMTKTSSGLAMTIEKANIPRQNEIANIQDGFLTDLVNNWILLNKENAIVPRVDDKGMPIYVIDPATGKAKIGLDGQPIVEMVPDPDFQLDFDVSIMPAKEFGMEAIKLDRVANFVAKWINNPMYKQRVLAVKDTLANGFNPEELMEPDEDLPVKEENIQLKQQLQKYLEVRQEMQDALTKMEIMLKSYKKEANADMNEQLHPEEAKPKEEEKVV